MAELLDHSPGGFGRLSLISLRTKWSPLPLTVPSLFVNLLQSAMWSDVPVS